MVKLIDQLHGFLNSEMVKAVAYLGEVVETLQAYAEVQPRVVTTAPALNPASDPPPPRQHRQRRLHRFRSR